MVQSTQRRELVTGSNGDAVGGDRNHSVVVRGVRRQQLSDLGSHRYGRRPMADRRVTEEARRILRDGLQPGDVIGNVRPAVQFVLEENEGIRLIAPTVGLHGLGESRALAADVLGSARAGYRRLAKIKAEGCGLRRHRVVRVRHAALCAADRERVDPRRVVRWKIDGRGALPGQVIGLPAAGYRMRDGFARSKEAGAEGYCRVDLAIRGQRDSEGALSEVSGGIDTRVGVAAREGNRAGAELEGWGLLREWAGDGHGG